MIGTESEDWEYDEERIAWDDQMDRFTELEQEYYRLDQDRMEALESLKRF